MYLVFGWTEKTECHLRTGNFRFGDLRPKITKILDFIGIFTTPWRNIWLVIMKFSRTERTFGVFRHNKIWKLWKKVSFCSLHLCTVLTRNIWQWYLQTDDACIWFFVKCYASAVLAVEVLSTHASVCQTRAMVCAKPKEPTVRNYERWICPVPVLSNMFTISC